MNARTQIVEAARALFDERSYASVSVRDIAEAAGVSPALVIKHCGSKAELFREVAVVQPGVDVFGHPLPALGAELVRRAVQATREGRPSPLSRALVRVVGAPDPDALRDDLHRAYLQPLAARLTEEGVSPEEAHRRAQLAMTLMLGLSANLRMLQLLDVDDEELVRRCAALVQDALDGGPAGV